MGKWLGESKDDCLRFNQEGQEPPGHEGGVPQQFLQVLGFTALVYLSRRKKST